jgi:flagella basal body P-ring formation protein FlgA
MIAGAVLATAAMGPSAWANDGLMTAVPVLTQPLTAGAKITPDMVAMKSVPADTVFEGTIKTADALKGMQAARTLPAGTPLSKLQVKPAMDVQNGALVKLVFHAPGLELAGTGQALEPGRTGDSIRVLNASSRATVVGVVVAANTVEVKAGGDSQ